MKLKVQEILAGGALALAALLSAPNAFQNARGLFNQGTYFFTIATNSLPGFTSSMAGLVPVFIPLFAGLAALFVLTGARKISLLATLIAPIMWFLTGILNFIWLYQVGATSGIRFVVLKDIFLGQVDFNIFLNQQISPVDFPWVISFLLMVAAVVLNLISRKGISPSQSGVEFHAPAPIPQSAPQPLTPPPSPVAPVPYGMKECPDCAEFIKANAIKCRFCDYRYE